MNDPFIERAKALVAQGADPRRAGSGAEERFGVPRRPDPREIFVVGGILGALVGILAMFALGTFGAWLFDLRPASSGTVRIASAVRDVIPAADTLSKVELVARLTPHPGGAAAPQTDRPSDRDQVEAALASIPTEQRSAALADLVRCRAVLHDPVQTAVARSVSALPPEDLEALERNARLPSLLEWAAHLTEPQAVALLALDLLPVLSNADLYGLLQALPTLDPLAARALKLLKNGTPRQQEILNATLDSLGWDDVRLERLIAAFRSSAPSLIKLLDGRLAACTRANREACR